MNLNNKDEKKMIPAIETGALSVGYRSKNQETLIARDIDFTLPRARLMAIVGVNGIGKSTLLRTLGNVQPALSGSIRLNGRDLDAYQKKELAEELSVVLTEPLATKNLTVWEVISLGRQPYTNWIGKLNESDLQKIRWAIKKIGLEPLQHKKCYELSDGQLQKTMIARALAQDTTLMLLDEPTTHLDLYHKVQILKLLQRIAHETKKTVVFTSHEIDMAIQLCDHILIMDKDQNYFGEPAALIRAKRFDALFPSDLIRFDTHSASFKVQN